MKPLNEIKNFSVKHQKLLASQFGVTSAEAFYEQASRNAAGVQAALKVTPAQLDKLVKVVEEHLSAKFIKDCQKPVSKHKRGVIVD